jgi:uncharacterized protein YraI
MRAGGTVSFARSAVVAGMLTIQWAVPLAAKPIATTRETNLRKAPGTGSEILALIPKETTVEVSDCRNGWCRVSWNGQGGYAIARNFDTASALRGPNAPVAAWQGDHGSSQKIAKTAREHKEHEHEEHEGEEHEREESGPEHSFILEIGTAGEWSLSGERPNFGGTIAAEIEP